MAIGRVWVGFLYTRTRPASQDPQPRTSSIINWIFFRAQTHPVGPCHFRAHSVAQSKKEKKNCLPNIDFLNNQTVEETQENPNLNKSETLCPMKKIPRSKQILLSNQENPNLNRSVVQSKKKKKCLPNTDFLSNQTIGETNFHYKIFPHQK